MGVFSAFLAACIIFTTVSSVATAANTCADVFASPPRAPTFHTYQASHTLSQVVRDNAFDYWYWSRKKGADYFGNELAQVGLVVGDTHPGNFILAPLNGRMRFFIADLKDAGEAPFILDFARLAMSTQAIYRRVEDRYRFSYTLEELFDAYVEGLAGHKLETPEHLKAEFETTMGDYRNLVDDYVDRKTESSLFKIKPGKVRSFTTESTKLNQAQITRAKQAMVKAIHEDDPSAEVLDFAVRVRERGGSKNSDRYWALVRSGRATEIVEFKEQEERAVSEYQPQAADLDERLMLSFWGELDKSIHVANIDGRSFLMRPKKMEIFSVPYNPKDHEEQEQVLSIARYDANYVGLLHGRQLSEPTYLSNLKKNKARILESLKSFSKDYLDRLEERAEDQL